MHPYTLKGKELAQFSCMQRGPNALYLVDSLALLIWLVQYPDHEHTGQWIMLSLPPSLIRHGLEGAIERISIKEQRLRGSARANGIVPVFIENPS